MTLVRQLMDFRVGNFGGSQILAIAAIIFFAPLLLTISTLIKIGSSGPVIVKRTRTTTNGTAIAAWEFRTVAEGSELWTTPAGNALPRSGLGKLLFRTRFYMLPQLVNIMHGELAFDEFLL